MNKQLGIATDIHSVKAGDYIKADGEVHEIAEVEYIRKRDKIRNWNVTTTNGRRFNMLEIGSYHKAMPPSHFDFHEIWWIFSAGDQEWCGLRIAHFRKASSSEGGSTDIVVIQGEIDPRRHGVRIWDDIKDREGWRKVKQIAIPDASEIAAAMPDENAYDMAKRISHEAGFSWTDPRTLVTYPPPGKQP